MKNVKKNVKSNEFMFVTSDRFRWNSVARYSGPKTRKRHSICVVGEEIYLYGGRGTCQMLNDFWKYKPSSEIWSEIKTKTCPDKPPCLQGHTLVEYNGDLYMFGGEISFAFAEEVAFWKFSILLNEWKKLLCNGTFPRGRRGHVSVVYKKKMYVHGGYLDLKGPTQEMWVYDLKKNTWSLVESAMSSKCPAARYQHGGAVFRDSFYISGGKSNAGNKFDAWIWDFLTENWSHIRTKGAPSNLYFHSCCVVQNDLFVFGGYTAVDKVNTKLWNVSLAKSYYTSSQKWKLCHFTNQKPLLALGTCRLGGVLQVVANKTKKPGYQAAVKYDFHKKQHECKSNSCRNASISSSALPTQQMSHDWKYPVSKKRKYAHLNHDNDDSVCSNTIKEKGFSDGNVVKATDKVLKLHTNLLPAVETMKFLFAKKRTVSAEELRSPLIQMNHSCSVVKSQKEQFSLRKSKSRVAKPANVKLIDFDLLSANSFELASVKLHDHQPMKYRQLSSKSLNSEQWITSSVQPCSSDGDFTKSIDHDAYSAVSPATSARSTQQRCKDKDRYSSDSSLLIRWSSARCVADQWERKVGRRWDSLHPTFSNSFSSLRSNHCLLGPKSSSSSFLKDPLVNISRKDNLSSFDSDAQKIQSLAQTYYSNATILEQIDQNLNDECKLHDNQRGKQQLSLFLVGESSVENSKHPNRSIVVFTLNFD